MRLTEKIEAAFSVRKKPAQVGLDDGVWQLDFEVEEALWFSGRDWHEVTWKDWQERSSAIYFFDPEAFAYYLPSLLTLSAENPNEWLQAVDSLIMQLDRTPETEGWDEGLKHRFLCLRPAEIDVLKEWLVQACEHDTYKGWGVAGSGSGDKFGRAFDTIDLLEKEIERKHSAKD